MIRHNGYKVEIHKVVTSDDYVLTLHRVLPPGDAPGRHATPVILQHGVLADSTCWMCNGAEHSFAFILVDAGSWYKLFHFSCTDIIHICSQLIQNDNIWLVLFTLDTKYFIFLSVVTIRSALKDIDLVLSYLNYTESKM